MYSINEIDELIVRCNKLFLAGNKFLNFTANKISFIPSGTTIDVDLDENTNKLVFRCCTKIYGYDKLYNTGLNVYTDLSDYYPGGSVSPELRELCYAYVKEADSDLYALMLNNEM